MNEYKSFPSLFSSFMCTDPASDPIGYYNLLMIKNPHWKQLRAFLTPSLSLAKIKKMYLLVDQVRSLIHAADKSHE